MKRGFFQTNVYLKRFFALFASFAVKLAEPKHPRLICVHPWLKKMRSLSFQVLVAALPPYEICGLKKQSMSRLIFLGSYLLSYNRAICCLWNADDTAHVRRPGGWIGRPCKSVWWRCPNGPAFPELPADRRRLPANGWQRNGVAGAA